MRDFLWTHLQEPVSTVHKWRVMISFLKRTCLVNSKILRTLSTRKSTCKSSTRNYQFTCLRSPTKRTFKRLIKDTLLWCVVMSTNLKNPKDQDDHKKGSLSNQPRLTRVTPTALLGSWGQQPIIDMTSLGTKFETHAYWQECAEEHPKPSSVVTHLLRDGDLDAGHCQMKASAVKEFVARKTPNIASDKAQETYWNRIKCDNRFGMWCPRKQPLWYGG